MNLITTFPHKILLLFVIGIFATSCAPKQSETLVSDNEVPTRYDLFESQNFKWMSQFVEGKAIAELGGESILIDQYGR